MSILKIDNLQNASSRPPVKNGVAQGTGEASDWQGALFFGGFHLGKQKKATRSAERKLSLSNATKGKAGKILNTNYRPAH